MALWAVTRRSSGERRLQLKWLLSGVTVFIEALTVEVWALSNPTALGKTVSVVVAIGAFALPVGIGSGS